MKAFCFSCKSPNEFTPCKRKGRRGTTPQTILTCEGCDTTFEAEAIRSMLSAWVPLLAALDATSEDEEAPEGPALSPAEELAKVRAELEQLVTLGTAGLSLHESTLRAGKTDRLRDQEGKLERSIRTAALLSRPSDNGMPRRTARPA